MLIKKYYDKQCFLFYNYFNFILFLKKVRKENEYNVIMFLSRDSYFLYLLYANMYPELKWGKIIFIYFHRDTAFVKEETIIIKIIFNHLILIKKIYL